MNDQPSVNSIAPDRDSPRDPTATAKAAPAMVSVNARGGASRNTGLKVALLCIAFALLASGALWGFNQYRAWKKTNDEKALAASKAENKSALVGRRRSFSSDPALAATIPKPPTPENSPPCLESTLLLDGKGQPVLSVTGAPMRICKDGKIFMPAGGTPIPLAQAKPPAPNPVKPPSRYGGELMVPAKEHAWGVPTTSQPARSNSLTSGVDANAQFARFLQQRGIGAQASEAHPTMTPVGQTTAIAGNTPVGGIIKLSQASADDTEPNTPATMSAGAPAAPQNALAGRPAPSSSNAQGAIGNLLTPSRTPTVTATLLGDRNMILPRGRSIDCSLATRVVNEVSGMAECVLASDVYSDNGKVVLLERGSQASGEYIALMTQGQRRLFILWSRVRTPHGVVINLASPASDALGTAGIGGYIDNRWGERLGAAVLLSMVKDAIALATAKAVSSGGAGAGAGIYAFQTTSSTGERMVNQVLNSTINIKPTLYANQGDRAAIYVARDLDFGSVYALRTR